MSRDRDDGPEPQHRRLTHHGRLVAGLITLVASILTIIAITSGWFASASGPTLAEYQGHIGSICSLANTEAGKERRGLRQFSREFPAAATVTRARNLILEEVMQQTFATTEVATQLSAIRPAQALADSQKQLSKLLKINIEKLQVYEGELNSLSSPLQLVALVAAVPRELLETNAAAVRGLLLQLGGIGCKLDPALIVPIVEWSGPLRRRLHREAERVIKGGTRGAKPHTGDEPLPSPLVAAAATSRGEEESGFISPSERYELQSSASRSSSESQTIESSEEAEAEAEEGGEPEFEAGSEEGEPAG